MGSRQPVDLAPWAQNLAWAARHYEEGDPRCTCMLCGTIIGAAENDPRWETHDRNCVGCAVCEIAIRVWKPGRRLTLEQRYHGACFERILRVRPKTGPAL